MAANQAPMAPCLLSEAVVCRLACSAGTSSASMFAIIEQENGIKLPPDFAEQAPEQLLAALTAFLAPYRDAAAAAQAAGA